MRRWVAVIVMMGLAGNAPAMTPPSLSVNVMPRSPVSGLNGLSDGRSGLSITTWHSGRSHLRSGNRSVDNPLREKSDTLRTLFTYDLPIGLRWTAVAALPVVRTRTSYAGGGDKTSGPGDLLFLLKYTLLQNPTGLVRRELQLLAGTELPTGKYDAEDGQGNRLPATQQPGSHSTDVLLGAAGGVNFRHVSLFGDSVYKRSGGAAYRFGDLLAVNLGVNLPFGPRDRLSLTGELNYEAAGRDSSSLTGPGVLPDKSVRDTGHEILYWTPGLQWRPTARWTLALAFQLPVYQNHRGTQLAPDLNTLLSVSGRWGRHGG